LNFKIKKLFTLLLFIGFLHTSSVKSAVTFSDAIFPELITSARALALGNAFLCKVDDHHAAFYNPAGLGTVRNVQFHIFNFHLETNDYLQKMAAGGLVTNIFQTIPKSFSLDGVRELVSTNKGKLTHARAHLFPNMTFRYVTLGALYSTRIKAMATESATTFDYAQRTDMGPTAAINFSLFGGIVKLGGSGTFLIRKEKLDTNVNVNNTISLSSSDYNSGSMLYFVGGTRVTLPIKWLPTFAGVIRNPQNKEFTAFSSGLGAPTSIKRTIDGGVSITPQIGKIIRMHVEANYRDILNAYSTTLIRRIQLGMEFDIGRVFSFRLGYADGFGSFGLGMKTGKFQVDLTTYAEDQTDANFRGTEDRRYVFSFSSGFGK
jgi:hypothetical protein